MKLQIFTNKPYKSIWLVISFQVSVENTAVFAVISRTFVLILNGS